MPITSEVQRLTSRPVERPTAPTAEWRAPDGRAAPGARGGTPAGPRCLRCPELRGAAGDVAS